MSLTSCTQKCVRHIHHWFSKDLVDSCSYCSELIALQHKILTHTHTKLCVHLQLHHGIGLAKYEPESVFPG
jgi:hypothetical protein